jgi:hypothetical protein
MYFCTGKASTFVLVKQAGEGAQLKDCICSFVLVKQVKQAGEGAQLKDCICSFVLVKQVKQAGEGAQLKDECQGHALLAADMLYSLLTCFTRCGHALLAADMLY